MYSGYIVMAYLWARMAQVSHERLIDSVADRDFFKTKVMTAEFYFAQLLPRTKSLAKTMMAKPKTIMQIDEELLHI